MAWPSTVAGIPSRDKMRASRSLLGEKKGSVRRITSDDRYGMNTVVEMMDRRMFLHDARESIKKENRGK